MIKKLLYFLLVFSMLSYFSFPLKLMAATDGPRSPAVDVGAANGSCTNGVNWGDPGLATEADDTNYLTITGNNFDAGELSDEIQISDFGFALTNVASIDGITVEVIGFTTLGGADYTTVSLFTTPGSNRGDNKATGALPTSDPGTTYQTFGGTSDDWFPAGTWTEAEIESANFGVALCFTASAANTRINVDHVKVTVTYTQSGSAPTVTSNTATGVFETGATINGEITATGGSNATVRGFAWGTSSTLANGDTSTTTETGDFGTGTFSQYVQNLLSNTTYYYRAYAANPTDTGYGSTIESFTTGIDGVPRRMLRLFQGYILKLFNGSRLIVRQQ